jgi:hypothetical protein
VLKNWLSCRGRRVLGRAFTLTEIRYVARRLAMLNLMAPASDANYRACVAAHVPLPETG